MENSSITPPPLPDQSKEKMSTGTKVLIGCGIGCGVIILFFLLIVGLGVWWALSTGEQVSTTRILGPNSLAAAKVENISDNQGAMEFITFFFQEAQKYEDRGASSELPKFMEKLRQYQQSKQNPAQWFKYVAPKEITLSIISDEARRVHLVVAANFNMGVRVAKTAFKMIFSTNEVNKENIISTPNGNLFKLVSQNPETGAEINRGVIGFHEGTILYSDNIEPAKSGLERLVHGDDSGELRITLDELFNALRVGEWLAYGVLDGELWRSTHLGQDVIQDELLFQIETMSTAANVQSADQVFVRIDIDWRNEEAAQTAVSRVEKQKAEWIEKTFAHGLQLEVNNTLTGKKQRIEFELNDLKNAVSKMFMGLEAEKTEKAS